MRRFHFEPSWLLQPGFIDRVSERWDEATANPPRSFCATYIWHHCSKLSSQFMWGWGANLGANLRARKGALLDQIKALDEVANVNGLSSDDWNRRYSLEAPLMEFFKGEEWQRRGGQKWLLQGDANTACFQAIANGRRRKCSIPCFMRLNGMSTGRSVGHFANLLQLVNGFIHVCYLYD